MELPAGYAQVVCSGHFGPSEWSNIFGLQLTPMADPLSSTDINDVAAGFAENYATAFAGALSPRWIFETCVVTYTPDGVSEIVGSNVPSIVGGDAGIDTPSSASMVISWRIGRAYRGGHPRTYLTGLVTDRMLDTKTWTADTVSEFQTAAATFLSGVDGFTTDAISFCMLVTFERRSGGVAVVPWNAEQIFSALARSAIGSQRRRMRH